MGKLNVQSVLYICMLDMNNKQNILTKKIMEKCETRTTILNNLFHVITKSDTYALLIRLSSISTDGCSNEVDNFKP